MSVRKPRLAGDRSDTMTSRHHTPYLSPSRLSLYAQCPSLYKRRYVDRIKDPATIDMEYGQAIHTGLDAQFKGGDAEITFMRDLKQRLTSLETNGAEPADWLVPQGLKLIAGVNRLGWSGLSEQKFWWVCPGFRVPITGVIDLWIPEQKVVVDWKTTQRAWSEKTAERYAFQQAIYTAAMFDNHQIQATFKFVVLGAFPGGGVQVIDATPQPENIARTLNKARDLAALIDAEVWACTCKDRKHEDLEAA